MGFTMDTSRSLNGHILPQILETDKKQHFLCPGRLVQIVRATSSSEGVYQEVYTCRCLSGVHSADRYSGLLFPICWH